MSFVDDIGREFLRAVAPYVAKMGEPVQTSFAPDEMEALARRSVLAVIEHPTPEDLFNGYCAGRTDGLRPYTLERLMSLPMQTESGVRGSNLTEPKTRGGEQ